jgi:tetratricopeptide (TPR) repeat protein
VAIDSTFASAWSLLAATLSNYGGSRSAIDSATTQAYRYRERLPALERDMVSARYFGLGAGRDRAKAIASYEAILQRGDSNPIVMVNLGEQLRTRREYARAESLNVAADRLAPGSGTAVGNEVELQLDQGKIKEAMAALVRLKQNSPGYGVARQVTLAYASGDDRTVRFLADSMMRTNSEDRRRVGLPTAQSLAVEDGRLRDHASLVKDARGIQRPGPNAAIGDIALEIGVKGPSPAVVARLDTVIAGIPFRDLPMIDRPYLFAAWTLARAGNAEKARAMLARYRAEMTDTSIRRVDEADLHTVVGEIALADGKPRDALVEFRRGDIGYDGAPADECAPCVSFLLGRAYDAAGKPDSAALFFEQYLATPYWNKLSVDLDPVRVPAIRERLGQLYESMGKADKAVENYRAFIELWKNADLELQPRVADARKRLARLTPVEKARP